LTEVKPPRRQRGEICQSQVKKDRGEIQVSGKFRSRERESIDEPMLGPRQMNRLRIIEALYRRPLSSRADLARHAQLSRETVSTLVEELVRAGLGLAVPINKATGELEADGILPGWRGIRPAEEMEARLGVPVALDNDANVGALGEKAFGAARGVDDLLYVRQPYPGVAGVAGEIGQVLSDPSGPIYRCGNRGCLEAVASPATLARETPARCRTRGQQHVRRRGRLRWVVDEFRRRRGS
jgi:predicted NBD/HSP70 family sugar kinase